MPFEWEQATAESSGLESPSPVISQNWWLNSSFLFNYAHAMLDKKLKPDFQRQGISKSSGKLSTLSGGKKERIRFDVRKEKKEEGRKEWWSRADDYGTGGTRATAPLPLLPTVYAGARMEQAVETARASVRGGGRIKLLCVNTEGTDFLAGPRQTSQPCRETELWGCIGCWRKSIFSLLLDWSFFVSLTVLGSQEELSSVLEDVVRALVYHALKP